ncbi:diguanylate cyclase [Zoogloea sp.]|uniref:diguanylate cyclase n=1 Tax=Zoogloea sp. TaxID=49181 RepID=UPI001415D0D1|nr:MAG: diguanylate cyclase [Zoogloea sp.]
MNSFTRRLLAGNLLIVLLISTLAGWAACSTNERHRELALARTQNLSQVLERYVASLIAKGDVVLSAMVQIHQSGLSSRRGHSESMEAAAARRFLAETPELGSVHLTDADGRIQLEHGTLLNMGEGRFFQQIRAARRGELVISEPTQSQESGQWGLILGRRLERQDGSFAGAALAFISSQHLSSVFAKLDLGAHGAISLRSGSLRLIARHPEASPNGSAIGTNTVSNQLKEAIHAYPLAGSYVAPTALDGIERINAYRKVSDYPLHVIVGISTETWRDAARRDMTGLAGLAASAVLITLLFSWLLHQAWMRKDLGAAALTLESERNRMLLRNASDGIHILDPRGQILEVSDSFCDMLGYARSELLHMNVRQWEAQASPSSVATEMHKILGQHRSLVFETRHQRSDGQIRDVQIHAVAVEFNGQPAIYCSARDITEHKAIVEALRLSEHRLQLASEAGEIGLWGVDLGSGMAWRSPRHARIFGYPDNRGAWSLKILLDHVVSADRAAVAATIDQVCHRGQVAWEARIIRKDGVERWISAKGEAVHNDAGELIHLLGTVVDITDSKQTEIRLACLNASLETLAVRDPLTGLYNRRFLDETLRQVMTAARRGCFPVSVILVDIDHFKTVNDTLGHKAGDRILQAVGNFLLRQVRDSDTACRYGGEEFLLVLPRTDADQALLRADTLRQGLARLAVSVEGQPRFITISAGVASSPDDGNTPESLIGRADAALYAAKRSGRNCVRDGRAIQALSEG